MTASKFRPTLDNPYLQLAKSFDDEDVELDRVVTQNGLSESVVKVGRHKNVKDPAIKIGTQEERESLVSAEGSHELD